jgi:cytochrome c oxidase subunit 4
MSLPRAMRPLAWVWGALLALLFASLGSAYLPLGRLNLVAGLAIALVKIALIVRWFMHLNRAPVWSALAALVAVCALALLAAFTVFEGATRPADPAGWQQPQQLPAARQSAPPR